jgi:hypothetical protein
VYARGGLAGYGTLLESPFLYVPHDALVPGVLKAGDLGDVAAALAPRPLLLEDPVDSLNRRAGGEALARAYAPARSAYREAGAADRLSLEGAAEPMPRWLLTNLLAP